MTEKEKVLDRLKKMKRMAESAASIGSEEEAQAFAAAVQKMLLDHKLDMTDIEFEEFEKEQPVIRMEMEDVLGKKERVAWSEKLAGIIARAHFCRIILYNGSSRIAMVGREEDLAVASIMLTTLQVAAYRLAKSAAYQHKLKLNREGGDTWTNKGFKMAFLDAFIERLRERYEEERRSRTAGNTTALVRVNTAEKAVIDFMKGLNLRRSSALSRKVAYNPLGASEGRKAADKIHLRADGMNAPGTRGTLKN